MNTHSQIWRISKPNPALQEIFAAKLGVSRVIAQVLVNRGITTLEEARAFLAPDTGRLHDPFLMKDMREAADRIRQAIDTGERIRIFGDYDVDGITSTAILMRVLYSLGASPDYYIPERLTEGYGMNSDAVYKAHADGVGLIITVDSGISSLEEITLAESLGIDVVVTDHHEPPEQIPQAAAVINPKQKECPYPFKDLAGAGVALKLGQALMAGVNETAAVEGAIPGELLELACLGTIADIVPLKGENRIIARNGLIALGSSRSCGLQELIRQCGISGGNVESHQVAFHIAPRINAAGRLGDATVAVKLLLTEDGGEASAHAAALCNLNEERQRIEGEIYRNALKLMESEGTDLSRDKVIVLASEGWHLGVIGIVASRLVRDFYRPVILLCIDGNTAKGSARSIPAFNMFEALKTCEGCLEKYGGHKQAAGMTLGTGMVALLREQINRYADEVLEDSDLMREICIDSEVGFCDLDDNLYRQVRMLAPYGCENPGPVLACRQTDIMEYYTVGADGAHLKMRVRDRQFMFEAIGFNLGSRQTALGGNGLYDLAFALDRNEWNGRSTLQLQIKDFKPADCPDNPAQPATGSEPGFAGGSRKTGFIEELFRDAATYLTDDFYRDIADKDEFYTKVAGVTFENRQEVVVGLYDGQELRLIREQANPHDTNAVRVETTAGVQVGYLNARLARHFAPLMDAGECYVTYVSQVTGGQDRNYGVNIVIQKVREESRDEYLQKQAQIRAGLYGLADEELMERIREALLGANPYREKQLEALEQLFSGRNTLAIFGTGRGKSAVFQTVAAFKALREGEMTVIVYPLRALVNDQYENMTARLGSLGLRVYRGNGSISTLERAMLFEALSSGEADILLTTPEFVAHHMRKLQAADRKIGFFVVDESHHIGLSSQAHRPLYKRLGELALAMGSPVTLAVTATANDEVADEIIETLDIRSVVIDPHVRTNLQLVDKRDWPDKNGYLKQVAGSGEKTIIYVNSRLQTVELASMLREAIPHMADRIIFYHAGLKSEQRNTIEQMFRCGDVSAVVSTSAFGEGIDIPDVKHIIVYHLNFNFTEFNQQCGRSGRDGETAWIHLLCGRRDVSINRFILETSAPARDNLVKLYTALKDMAARLHPVTATNDDIAKILRLAGVRFARANMVSAGLGVLEELELIQRESMGRERRITLLPAPQEKVDIESSLRYMEGQEEKQAFDEFQQYFFQAAPDDLLKNVNSPIYPGKYAEKQAGGRNLPAESGI